MSPLMEISAGKLELVNAARNLDGAQLALACVEGSSDKKIRAQLAKKTGRQGFLGKNPLVRITLGNLGLGSTAEELIGEPIELPVEDRGLIILDSLTADLSSSPQLKEWNYAAVINAHLRKGGNIDDLKKRQHTKTTGLINLFNTLAHPSKHKEEGINSTINELLAEEIEKIDKIWGGSPEILNKNKQELDYKVVEMITEWIVNNPKKIAQIKNNLNEMTKIATGNLHEAIKNAQQQFSTILESNPHLPEITTNQLSPLGKILLARETRNQTESSLPESPNTPQELVEQSFEIIKNLTVIDYEKLAEGDGQQVEQIINRNIILRNFKNLIPTEEGFTKVIDSRRKEISAFKHPDIKKQYSPEKMTIEERIKAAIYLKTVPNTKFLDLAKGELLATVCTILNETQNDLSTTSQELASLIVRLRRPEKTIINLDFDEKTFAMLGINLPEFPNTQVDLPQNFIDSLEYLVATLPPDPSQLNTAFFLFEKTGLIDTFKGSKSEKTTYETFIKYLDINTVS